MFRPHSLAALTGLVAVHGAEGGRPCWRPQQVVSAGARPASPVGGGTFRLAPKALLSVRKEA